MQRIGGRLLSTVWPRVTNYVNNTSSGIVEKTSGGYASGYRRVISFLGRSNGQIPSDPTRQVRERDCEGALLRLIESTWV